MHTLIGMHMHSKAAGQITFGEHCVCVCCCCSRQHNEMNNRHPLISLIAAEMD